jgi:ornithine cyclodeaminase/alanine dehydrogenase-like protein (mu-crystallin family)
MAAAREFQILSDQLLESLKIPTRQITDTIEAAIRGQDDGQIHTAPKSVVLPGGGRYIMSTLSSGDKAGLTVVKSVTVSPDNPSRGLKGIEGVITLQDSQTGVLKAVMASSWITAVRTAGLSLVAARRLANPQSRIIAFVGCGVQAHTHLKAFAEEFPIDEVRVVGRGKANIDKLCAAATEMGLYASAPSSPEEALRDADIIVTSVTISFDLEPFLDPQWMKPGAFATITDAGIPWLRDHMNAFQTIIIDDEEQEAASSKKMVDPSLVSCELRKLVTGELNAEFENNKRAAFVFRGLAIGDFAVASLAYEMARVSSNIPTVEW